MSDFCKRISWHILVEKSNANEEECAELVASIDKHMPGVIELGESWYSTLINILDISNYFRVICFISGYFLGIKKCTKVYTHIKSMKDKDSLVRVLRLAEKAGLQQNTHTKDCMMISAIFDHVDGYTPFATIIHDFRGCMSETTFELLWKKYAFEESRKYYVKNHHVKYAKAFTYGFSNGLVIGANAIIRKHCGEDLLSIFRDIQVEKK